MTFAQAITEQNQVNLINSIFWTSSNLDEFHDNERHAASVVRGEPMRAAKSNLHTAWGIDSHSVIGWEIVRICQPGRHRRNIHHRLVVVFTPSLERHYADGILVNWMSGQGRRRLVVVELGAVISEASPECRCGFSAEIPAFHLDEVDWRSSVELLGNIEVDDVAALSASIGHLGLTVRQCALDSFESQGKFHLTPSLPAS